jgi:hypothetical protein
LFVFGEPEGICVIGSDRTLRQSRNKKNQGSKPSQCFDRMTKHF